MKIERYFSVLVILMAGLFLVNVSWSELTFAAEKWSSEAKVKSAQKADTGGTIRRINPIKPRVIVAQAPTVPTCVQCWNVPATSGAGNPGTVCTTCVPYTNVPAGSWNVPATSGSTGETLSRPPAVVVAPACPVVTPPDTPWGVLGAILQAPFVLGQCIFGACPAPGC